MAGRLLIDEFSLSLILSFYLFFEARPKGGQFLRCQALGIDLERGLPVREGLGIDDALMHPGRQDHAQSVKGYGRAIIVAQIGANAGQDELERLAGLLDQRQAFDQNPGDRPASGSRGSE